MNKIFFVRHGESEDNVRGILSGRRDVELTVKGTEQALQAAKVLEALGIRLIYSSPLIRAKKTARIIADTLGIKEILIHDDLIERDYGEMEGCLEVDIERLATRTVKKNGEIYPITGPGVEEYYPTMFERGKKVLEEIRRLDLDSNILLVAHVGIGRAIRAANNNWNTIDELLEHMQIRNGEIIELD